VLRRPQVEEGWELQQWKLEERRTPEVQAKLSLEEALK
jgi:hypothetical protein